MNRVPRHRRRPSGRPPTRSTFRALFVIATLLLSLIPALASPALAQPDAERPADSAVTGPPVEPPTGPPVDPPTGPPVEPPTGPPVDPPAEPPVEPPAGPPVEPPAGPPVEPPAGPPVEPPAGPPVEPPVDLPDVPVEVPTEVPPADLPVQVPQPVDGTPASPSTGSVTVNYRLCPPGTDMLANAPALAGACTLSGGGADFNLAGATGDLGSQATGAAPGSVTYAAVPAGNVTLTQIAPPPTGGLAIFCEGNTPYGSTKPYARTALSAGSSVDLEVLAEEQISCDWYVGPPEAAGGTVTVYTWNCEAGTVANNTADPGYYPAQCATEHLNIPIALADATGNRPTTTQAKGTRWSDVVPDTAGRVTISKEIPGGYGEPMVYCGTLDAGTQMLVPATGGSVTLTPAAMTFEYQCNWYNIPVEGGTLTLYKWQCEPGTVYGSTDPDYYPAQCATEHLNIPFTVIDGTGEHPMTTRANGTQWDDLAVGAQGMIAIRETIPDGYGDPVVTCGTLDEDTQTLMTATGGTVVLMPAGTPFDYQCNWYNLPTMAGSVTVRNWECPQGVPVEKTAPAHAAACTQPMSNVTFTLTDGAGSRSLVTANGQVVWNDVQMGSVTIAGEVPTGYSAQPVVFCSFRNGPMITGQSSSFEVVNGVVTSELDPLQNTIDCDWYNQYAGQGDLVIYKWTCPEGYDPGAGGANPKADCTEATNGITFVLDQPAGVDLQTDTGDSIAGAVSFGGLTPGNYVVSEVVPEGIASVFVHDCVGLNTGSVHSVPLSVGPTLAMSLSGGDDIRCDWYNVPDPASDYGWMTVIGFRCTTVTYVSDIDCEIFEEGRRFDLQVWNGTAWADAATGTTNTAGQLTWNNLIPGTYRVVEQGGAACRIDISPTDGNSNLLVHAKSGSTVKVYSCGAAPQPGGQMPTKYLTLVSSPPGPPGWHRGGPSSAFRGCSALGQ